MAEKMRDESRNWIRSRERGSAEAWSVLLGAVAQTLGVAPAPPPLPDLRDPGLYLDFFPRTLDFAICPRISRHPPAISAGIGDKARAWDWWVDQARTGVPDPEWRRRESIDRIGIILARLLRRIGGCRLPLSAGPPAATQPFELWNAVTDCRFSHNQWALGANDAECKGLYDGASRNVARARTRLGLEQARLHAGADAAIRDQNGNLIHEPSGGEFPPPASDAALFENASCPALGSTWNTFGNPSTPKGEAQNAPPGAPEPKLPKSKEAAESERDDLSFTHRNTAGLPKAQVVATVTVDRVQRAVREPARGWPDYSILYPMGGRTLVVRDPCFVSGITKTWSRSMAGRQEILWGPFLGHPRLLGRYVWMPVDSAPSKRSRV